MSHDRTRWVAAMSAVAVAACVPITGRKPLAPCTASSAQPINLAVGAYLSMDPASNAGCIALPTNAATADSAEYLLVPQSASGVAGRSSAFLLQGGAGSLTASVTANAVAPPPPSPLPT